MKINKHHGTYNRMARVLPVKYIVVHYTGSGTSAAGSALANCKYFAGGNRQASANYFIDDSGIWEYADPEDYATWHCGDGGGKYGITNANSVGIEVCLNGDKPFTDKEIQFLSELVQHLMKKFSVAADHVVRHYDASRKMCPYYYAKRSEEWTKLRKKITGGTTAGWIHYANGWKYKDSDGNFVTNKWIQDKGEWYFLKKNGYMAAEEWAKDNTGWCWMDASGKITKDKWIKDKSSWYYLKGNGYMAADEWIRYKDAWYYLKADGVMATGKTAVLHMFDSDGKCTK